VAKKSGYRSAILQDISIATWYAMAETSVCLSVVCPYECPSRCCIVSKRHRL